MTDLPNYRSSQRGPFFQTALDAINVLFGVLFIVSLAASLPLAVFLMFFAQF